MPREKSQNTISGSARLFKKALANYQNGNLAMSCKIISKLLESCPDHPDGHHLLGLIEAQHGKYDKAVAKISLAVKKKPDNPEFNYNYGYVLQASGNRKRAIDAYRNVIRLVPDHVEAHYNLGILFRDLGNMKEAIMAFRRLVAIKPNLSEGYCELGNVLSLSGRHKEAITSYEQAITLNPGNSIAYYNIAIVFRESGMFKRALDAVDKAIHYTPNHAEAYVERGNILMLSGEVRAALDAFTAAVQRDPQLAQARSNRGRALFELGQIENALLAYNRAIKLESGLAEAHCGLGNVLMAIGRSGEAIACFRYALEINPDYSQAHSNLLFILAAQAALSPSEMLYEQKQWDVIHGKEGRKNRFSLRIENCKSSRRLRIGYVSADLYRHPVSYFFEPLLAGHDADKFEIFCYDSKQRNSDGVTERLRDLVENWRYVTDKSDSDLAKLIHHDKIDILVDLTGHFEGGRLKTFSYKPAPVQASYLGYIAATGLEAMDYWITDTVIHPQDTEELTEETIYRLPRCAYCYFPPDYAPDVAKKVVGGPIVFGSFANLSKITHEVIVTWCQLLLNIPDSRLTVMDRSFNDTGIREQFLTAFTGQGIPSEQLQLRKAVSHEEYLKMYSDVDIVLDTFPRTGGTTTAEALWMGVPVITKAGKRHAERISASKLSALGLNEFIALTNDEYINLAESLAMNSELLQELRLTLRDRFKKSELFDGSGLARAMEKGFIEMWKSRIS